MAISATAVLLSRLTNIQNVVRIVNNRANVTPPICRSLSLVTRTYAVDINSIVDTTEDEPKPKKKLSKAMKAYLERAKEHDEFMKKEITEYQIGKRHLANMMGEDPETFSQKDIHKSIRYLFPSGIYDRRAKPIMEEPEKIFPARKAAEFDETGRPHHTLFYTCKPNYYQLLHDIVGHIYSLNDIEDKAVKNGIVPREDDKINLLGSEWLKKEALENRLLETLQDEQYEKFIAAAERLAEHPHAFRVKDFLLTLRSRMIAQSENLIIPKPRYTSEGRPFVTVKDCKRKSARANVTVFGNGTGQITINGKDIRYFQDFQSREQVSDTFFEIYITTAYTNLVLELLS